MGRNYAINLTPLVAHMFLHCYEKFFMVSLSFGHQPGPEVIKLFSCSTQLSTNVVLLINLTLLTTAISFLLNPAEHENFSASKYENANYWIVLRGLWCSSSTGLDDLLHTVEPRYLELAYFELPLISKWKSRPCFNMKLWQQVIK